MAKRNNRSGAWKKRAKKRHMEEREEIFGINGEQANAQIEDAETLDALSEMDIEGAEFNPDLMDIGCK